MRSVRRFPAEPDSVPAARRFATAALRDTPADVREAVELMVSELATNGVRHARTSFDLVIHRTADEIRIEVTDRGGGSPEVRSPTPDDPTGRGLLIVDLLAKRWGVDHASASGKTVWFTVSADPRAA
jgi:anti-sigma regulatory factor (Ser/Thr protein kinase)